MNPTFLIVDLFCGFGGTTTGFMDAEINGEKICKVIACVNHDPKAIKSHWLNHQDVKHFEEDIRTLDLTELIKLVNHWRAIYSDAKLILWASLECTNFSKAKGGMARDADSRTLADHLFRYITALEPDYIQIENVVEFKEWGPVRIKCKNSHPNRSDLCLIKDKKTKQLKYGYVPIVELKGIYFKEWAKKIDSFGYYNDWKNLNAADFGAFTSRTRLFGCFAKQGLPLVWPEQTHAKKPTGSLKKWNAVKHCLDFNDEGRSIFNRKKPLVENTLIRIYAGLVKFVANGDEAFLSNYKSGHPSSKNTSIETVSGTLTTVPTQSLVQTNFLLKYNSTNGKTKVHHPPSIDEPAPTIAVQGRLGLITNNFLNHYYGNGFNTSVDDPSPTLTTKDRISLISQHFISRDFKTPTNTSIDDPAGAITTVPKLNLIKCNYFLINPQFNNTGSSIENPCFTLIASMHKRAPSLIKLECGNYAIEVLDNDSPMTIKIKQLMAFYGIIDVKQRMLRVPELLQIQGFPINYKMVGNQADQKKFIGNSVEPKMPKAWIIRFYNEFTNDNIKVA